MHYDKNRADLFILSSAKLLCMSLERMKNLIPLKIDSLKNISEDNLDKLDAFRVRFCDLQDSLGNKTFRSILTLEEEHTDSVLDVLNKMEKRKIIASFDDWKALRNIRNLFSHDYPETDEEKCDILNIAYSNSLKLIGMVDNVIFYIQNKLNFPMDQFSYLLKKEEEK